MVGPESARKGLGDVERKGKKNIDDIVKNNRRH